MIVLLDSGRWAMAESVALRPMHLAWGSGNGVWPTPPQPSQNSTALLAEFGRRQISEACFATPDASGDIVLSTGIYSRSVAPTRFLYVRAEFDYADAVGLTVREIGLFVGGATNAALPAEMRYFVPDQVTSLGKMMLLQNTVPILRSAEIREKFELVVEF